MVIVPIGVKFIDTAPIEAARAPNAELVLEKHIIDGPATVCKQKSRPGAFFRSARNNAFGNSDAGPRSDAVPCGRWSDQCGTGGAMRVVRAYRVRLRERQVGTKVETHCPAGRGPRRRPGGTWVRGVYHAHAIRSASVPEKAPTAEAAVKSASQLQIILAKADPGCHAHGLSPQPARFLRSGFSCQGRPHPTRFDASLAKPSLVSVFAHLIEGIKRAHNSWQFPHPILG